MAGVSDNVRGLLNGWVDLAFPPLCAGCGDFSEDVSGICQRCRDRFDRYEHPLCLTCEQPVLTGVECPECKGDSFLLYAFGNYVDPLRESVIQFKFKGVTGLADYFADEIHTTFGEDIAKFAALWLVPIPLHESREHERGYNQAAVLARKLGKKLAVEVNDDLLVRVGKTKPQARLRDAERALNVKGVFSVLDNAHEGDAIILVDDVVTGGHTVREARAELCKAGFSVPAVISIAHGL